MAKLHLELNELTVESFETAPGGGQPGTVRANEGTHPFECGDSDLVSCGGSCHVTSCENPATCYFCPGNTEGHTCNCTVFDVTCQQTAPALETCCGVSC